MKVFTLPLKEKTGVQEVASFPAALKGRVVVGIANFQASRYPKWESRYTAAMSSLSCYEARCGSIPQRGLMSLGLVKALGYPWARLIEPRSSKTLP